MSTHDRAVTSLEHGMRPLQEHFQANARRLQLLALLSPT